MPRTPTASRYAQAAFEIARDSGAIDAWADDLQRAQEVVGVGDIRAYLEVPKVSFASKMEVLRTSLSGLNPLVVNLVAILTARNKVGLLPSIAEAYQRLTDDHLNRVRAEVVTAVPMEDQQRDRLAGQLAELLGKEVAITTSEEPEVLGGMIARVGDRIIDGSIRGRLRGLRRSLGSASG